MSRAASCGAPAARAMVLRAPEAAALTCPGRHTLRMPTRRAHAAWTAEQIGLPASVRQLRPL